MLSTDFAARDEAIVRPRIEDFPGDRPAFSQAYAAYNAGLAELRQEFADALAHEHLGETVAPGHLETVAAPVFRVAYENGHSSGYSEIENQYIDLAELAATAYSVALSI